MKGGQGFWAFFRQADVDRISKHPDEFSSAQKSCFINDVAEESLPMLRTMYSARRLADRWRGRLRSLTE